MAEVSITSSKLRATSMSSRMTARDIGLRPSPRSTRTMAKRTSRSTVTGEAAISAARFADHVDDAGEVDPALAGLGIALVDRRRVGAKLRLRTRRLRRFLRELQILQHHVGREARLIAAVGRR